MTVATAPRPARPDGRPLGFTPEAELLVCCARTRLDPPMAERLRALARRDLDWPRVVQTAHSHAMTPLLHRHLTSLCPDLVPPEVLGDLGARVEENTWRSLFLTGELICLLAVFEAHDILAIPYKGPTLAAAAYGNVALRQYCDLDILVPPRDVPRSRELLAAEGYSYRPQAPLTRAQEAVLLRFPGELLFAREDGRAKVDLHWTLTPKHFPWPINADRLQPRLQPTALGGATVPTLAPEDLLLVLCVHNSKHRWDRLSWIADVAELVRAHERLDWDRLLAQARAWGGARMLYLGLHLASDLLGAPLPAHVARAIAEDAMVPELAVEVLARLFRPPGSAEPAWAEARFYFRARERLRDRIEYGVRSLTTPTVYEVSLCSLPRWLACLYYPLRPIRLAAKYGALLGK